MGEDKTQGERIQMPKNITDELEDVPVEDDFFEKILKEDIPIPTDDDEAGSDTSDKKVADSSNEDQKPESVETLKARIAQLEKEAKGRLNDVVRTRQDKAELRSELDQLKTAVISLLNKRNSGLPEDEEEPEAKEPLADTRRAVEFGDDNSAFVDLSEVKQAISAETAKTQKELDALKAERAQEQAQQNYIANVKSVIDEDEPNFSKAFVELKDIYNDLNNSVIDIQRRTGERDETGTVTQDRALELIEISPEGKAFMDKYPGIDPTRIARAFNSKVDLKHCLRHIAKLRNYESSESVLDDKIKAAKNKPGNLAGQENRTSDASNLIERIAGLSVLDLENLSDAEAAKVEAMLLKEELKSN